MERAKRLNWCFTLNNYNEEDIKMFDDLECQYLIYGKEKGENGTEHLQGYVQLSSKKRLPGMKKIHDKEKTHYRRDALHV